MNTNTTQNNMDAIDIFLNKIEKNELESHSKTYFRLKLIAFVGLIVAIFVVSVLLISFIFFSMRTVGQTNAIGFDRQSFNLILLIFSWKLFLLDLVLIVFLSWLLRAFRFGYKIPGLYLLFGLFVILLAVGFVLDRDTPFHDRMMERADRNELPFFGEVYEGLRQPLIMQPQQ